MDKISFIIVNYNTYALTRACVQSIVAADIPCAIEIIIVDNASQEPVLEPFEKLSPDVSFLRSNENLGFAKGNNLGIAQSTGNLICLINSDARLESVDFEHLLVKAKSEDIGFVTCKLIYPDGGIQNNCQAFPSALRLLLERCRLHKLLPPTKRSRFMQGFYFNHERSDYTDWAWGAFLLFDRKLLDLIGDGKLPDKYFMYGEDLLWGYKAYQSGKRTWYSAENTVIHEVGASMGERNKQARDNLVDFIRSNYPAWHVRLLLPLI